MTYLSNPPEPQEPMGLQLVMPDGHGGANKNLTCICGYVAKDNQGWILHLAEMSPGKMLKAVPIPISDIPENDTWSNNAENPA